MAIEARCCIPTIHAVITTTPAIPMLGQVAGYGWQLFRGCHCVGTSEKSCATAAQAIKAVQLYAERFDYGRVEVVTRRGRDR